MTIIVIKDNALQSIDPISLYYTFVFFEYTSVSACTIYDIHINGPKNKWDLGINNYELKST